MCADAFSCHARPRAIASQWGEPPLFRAMPALVPLLRNGANRRLSVPCPPSCHCSAMGRTAVFFIRPATSPMQKKSVHKHTHFFDGDLAGNRTRDCAVRGRRLNRLTTRPYSIVGGHLIEPSAPHKIALHKIVLHDPRRIKRTAKAAPGSPIFRPSRDYLVIIAYSLLTCNRFCGQIGKIFAKIKKTSACAAYR